MENRGRITWAIVGAVVALLVVAGVDALRSSPQRETVAHVTTAASTTRTDIATVRLPPCARRDLRISIEIREEVASVVVRNVGADACHRALRGWHLRIEDRVGRVVDEWAKPQVPVQPLIVGDFRAGDEVAFWLPRKPECDSTGPYLARVTVGPYSASLDDLPPRAITCI